MVRLTLSVALVAVLLGTGSAGARETGGQASEPAAGATFALSGRGWGHGVGMSQYGARGFADRGATYQQILAHYYRGTSLGASPLARVRVLLAEKRKTLRIGSAQPLKVRDGEGAVHDLEAGTYPLGPALKLDLGGSEPQALPTPLVFTPGGAPLELSGKRYRGTIEIAVEEERLRAINSIGLEPYLYGVVPDEVPPDWPAEALKAQAVAARSYALAVRRGGPFDLFADVRSQVYGGIGAEEPTTTEAVSSTAGQVLLYGGEVATTYFFSTSGGRTANIEDVWDNADPVPYLVSVPDPYDSSSPLHTWGPVVFTAAKVAKALGVSPPVLDARPTFNTSRRVEELVLVTAAGETRVPASLVRQKLGLRSTWFRVGVLALRPLSKPVVFGSRARLTGLARGFKDVTVEQRPAGGTWGQIAPVQPAKDRTFGLRIKPAVTTWYRLVSGDVAGAPVRVLVAPRIRLDPVSAPDRLSGAVKPALGGAIVVVQRQDGAGWSEVARTTVDEGGAFVAQLALAPGTYRARVAPRGGFATGVSATLRIE